MMVQRHPEEYSTIPLEIVKERLSFHEYCLAYMNIQ